MKCYCYEDYSATTTSTSLSDRSHQNHSPDVTINEILNNTAVVFEESKATTNDAEVVSDAENTF